MTFSFRLQRMTCLKESDEWSASDEPYVLVTAARLLAPPGHPQSTRTFRYGPWNHFDEGDSLEPTGERPFWGAGAEPWEPEDIFQPDDVAFVVSVMEHDHGPVEGYRQAVEAAARASLALSFGQAVPARLDQLASATRAAVFEGFGPLDDRVDTRVLRLDASDLALPAGQHKDKVLQLDGGDQGRWELACRFVHHQRDVFAPSTRLAAVSRELDKMELWAVGHDGVLRGNWFHGRWHGWYRLHGRQLPPGAHLAALSRQPGRMEVWGIGTDGQVHGVAFEEDHWRDWYTLGGAHFKPGSPVAAVSRHPERMEVWAIDNDGQVRGAFFDDSRWQPAGGWYHLPGITVPSGSHLAAASRHGEHLQLWVVGDHGPLHTNRFDGRAWSGWQPLPGANFGPGARLAAVVLKGGADMHVLAVDLDHHLRDFWYEGDTPRGWYQAGHESFAVNGAAIAAVSRQAGRFEAWSTTLDGQRRGNPHEPGGWRGWYPLGGEAVSPYAPAAALSMHGAHMEVWFVGPQGVMGNAFRDAAWQGWYPLRWSFVA